MRGGWARRPPREKPETAAVNADDVVLGKHGQFRPLGRRRSVRSYGSCSVTSNITSVTDNTETSEEAKRDHQFLNLTKQFESRTARITPLLMSVRVTESEWEEEWYDEEEVDE